MTGSTHLAGALLRLARGLNRRRLLGHLDSALWPSEQQIKFLATMSAQQDL